jgi:hypothetical protein
MHGQYSCLKVLTICLIIRGKEEAIYYLHEMGNKTYCLSYTEILKKLVRYGSEISVVENSASSVMCELK